MATKSTVARSTIQTFVYGELDGPKANIGCKHLPFPFPSQRRSVGTVDCTTTTKTTDQTESGVGLFCEHLEKQRPTAARQKYIAQPSSIRAWVLAVTLVFAESLVGLPSVTAKPLDDLLRLLPAGGTMAMGVDFKELRKSPHFGAAVGLLTDMDDVGVFRVGENGPLSPKTVDEMAVVVLPNGQPIVAIRGTELKIDSVVDHYRKTLGSAFKESRDNGRHLFTVEPNIDALFVDKNTVIVGRPKELTTAIAVAEKQKKSVLVAGTLKSRIKKAQRSAPFWIVGELSAKNRKALRKKSAVALSDISGFVGHASLAQGFDFLLKTDCATTDGSAMLSELVNSRLDGLREKTALRLLGIGAYLDKIQVQTKGKTVELQVRLADAQVNTLMTVGPQVYRAIRN